MRKAKLKTSGIELYLNLPKVALDLETTGLDWKTDTILGISLSNGKASTYFWWKDLEIGDLNCIKALLEDYKCVKVFHNAKFDLHFLRKAGFKIAENIEDTMIMSQLSDENGSHKLKDLAQRHIDPNAKSAKEALMESLGENAKKFTLATADPKLVAEYARMDAYYTFMLHEYYHEEVMLRFKNVFLTEKELLHVILDMEENGIYVDRDHLEVQAAALTPEADQLEKEIYAEIKKDQKEFNLLSNDQVGELLEEKFDIKLPKTDKGKPKVDRYTLQNLNLPIAKKLEKYRQIRHIVSTYCLGLIEKIKGNRIYCEFNQNGARTGRFSCSNPNLQQIPRELGDIRGAFKPEKNSKLFMFDYDQVEMRIFAHYTKDPGMLDAFSKNLDVHAFVAAKLYNKKLEEVTKSDRRNGKTINFGIIYGMGKRSFSIKLDCTEEQAGKFRDWYFTLFPRVKQFQREVIKRIETRGFVFNLYGRYRRHLANEGYKAVDSLIQGCAADVIKKAMVTTNQILNGKRSKLLLCVHDELVYNIVNGEEYLVPKIREAMENFPEFAVPLKVTVQYSEESWAKKEDWHE